MASGVAILDTVTRPCTVKQIGKYTFTIILTQGLNRQIRRMCEAFHYKVMRLVRVRIMNIELGELKPGEYRSITRKEWAVLQEKLKRSENPGKLCSGSQGRLQNLHNQKNGSYKSRDTDRALRKTGKQERNWKRK